MKKLLSLIVLLVISAANLRAAPFNKQIQFTQSDGTQITIHGKGDDFSAVFETLDGYTVVFDPTLRAYCFASLAANGDLVSNGVQVHLQSGAGLGLAQHIRMGDVFRREQVRVRREKWEQGLKVQDRWNKQKASMRAYQEAKAKGLHPAPPTFTTLGNKLGLTILVDFNDEVANIPQADMEGLLNSGSYTNYGNNGSMRKFFLDDSKGLLNYSNYVTVYLRVTNYTKAFLNNPTNDCGVVANLMIQAAMQVLTNRPDYVSTILPALANLSVNGNNQTLAFNCLYVGENSGVFTKGLWPHAGALDADIPLGNGKSIHGYLISNIGNVPTIGTLCHENGHLLCGFPDEYSDGSDGGGVGTWSLMSYGVYNGDGGKNPSPVDAYLKRMAGWATTIDLTTNVAFTASLSMAGADFNKFYRFQKPGVSTEYYILENRQQTGRGLNNDGAGILIYHIDELGDRNIPNTNYNTTHTNEEIALVQADGLYQIQQSPGADANDPYYFGNLAAAYTNVFKDSTLPSARWWDGSASGIVIADFSTNANTMTFTVGILNQPTSVAITPASPIVTVGQTANLTAVPTGNAPFSYQWQYNNANLPGATNATLTLTNVQASAAGHYTMVLSNALGIATATANLTVQMPSPVLAQTLANSPVAYWRLNEVSGPTAFDYIGGFNGTDVGPLQFGVGGPTTPAFSGFDAGNTAYQFNGTNTSVLVPALNLNTNTVTITAWIKINEPEGNPGIFGWEGVGNHAQFMLGDNDNRLTFYWNDEFQVSDLVVPSNQWAFVALTVSPTEAVLYLATNATLASWTNTSAYTNVGFNSTSLIGNNPFGRFSGGIDEVAVYNQALTFAQISALVSAANTAAPTVALTAPAEGAGFTAPATVNLSASVVTNGHSIAKVQFYSGASLLNEDTTPPYNYTWGSVAAGTYTVYARVVYDGSSAQLSLPATISVNGVSVNTTPTNIVFAVSGTNLNLSWPTDHIGWRLLEQTNQLAAGVSLNPLDWATVAGSTGTNLVAIPIVPAKPTGFYRLIYP